MVFFNIFLLVTIIFLNRTTFIDPSQVLLGPKVAWRCATNQKVGQLLRRQRPLEVLRCAWGGAAPGAVGRRDVRATHQADPHTLGVPAHRRRLRVRREEFPAQERTDLMTRIFELSLLNFYLWAAFEYVHTCLIICLHCLLHTDKFF